MKYIFILILCSSVIFAAQKKDTSVTYLNPVTVTAMRYAEPLIEVPMATTIITNSQYAQSKMYGLNDALNLVPGVFTQSRFGNQDVRITIRGYGARGAGDRSNAGTSRGIKFYIDGVPETEPDGRTAFDNVELNNITQIEVIRSNASAIWGNAAGGVVSMTTIPKFTNNLLNFSLSGGAYGFFNYNVKGGTELQNGKLYASYSNTKSDGYRQNSNSERQVANVGFVSYLAPASLLTTNLTGSINSFYLPGPLTQLQFDSMPSMANPNYLTRKERRFNKSLKLSFNLEHSINQDNIINAMAFVNPKYLQRSERNTYRDFNRYHVGMNLNYRNIKNFGDMKNILMVGIDEAYQDGAILLYNLTADGERGATLKDNKSEGANTFGAFFQDEFQLEENMSLILGGRYDDITYFSQNFMTLNSKQNRSFTKFTPKAALSYRFSPDFSVYANFGGGVEVPAGNETDVLPGMDSVLINTLLEPIESTSFEIGTKHNIDYKNSWVDYVSYDVAAYLINVKNDIIPYSGGKFYFTAGETQRTGLELGLNIHTSFGLTLNSAFTYSNNIYKKYIIDSAYYKNPNHYNDLSDNKVAGLPDFYYSLILKYDLPFYDKVYVEFGINGVGKYYTDDANKYEVPSYTIFNAKIGTNQSIDCGLFKSNIFVAVNNLTDEKYASSSFINPDLDSSGKPMFLEPGLPMNIIAGMNIEF